MSIILQPAYSVLPSYRPIEFWTQLAIGGGYVIENALVTILKNGVAIGPPIVYKPIDVFPLVSPPNFTESIFKIDIQKYCQDLLEPFEELPSIFPTNTVPIQVNTKFSDLFSISIEYDKINPSTGLLESVGIAPEVSNDFYIYTTALQHQFSREMNLVPYTGTPYGANTNRLSNSPNPKKVCINDNEYISIVQEETISITAVRIVFYDHDGLSLGFGLSPIGSTVGSTQFTANVGLIGLSNLSYVDGGFPGAITDIGSYEIEFGYLVVWTGPLYAMFVQSDTYYYTVQNSCCEDKTLRLHWMNLLGGADSFTFKYNKDLVLSTSSDTGEKALNWATGTSTPHAISDIGKMKIKSEGITAYEADSGILTNEEAFWLSEILTSPKVYAEVNGNFVPVLIDKKTQSISRREGKIRMSLTAMLANDMIIQRM